MCIPKNTRGKHTKSDDINIRLSTAHTHTHKHTLVRRSNENIYYYNKY